MECCQEKTLRIGCKEKTKGKIIKYLGIGRSTTDRQLHDDV